tara:strand:- start:130 stop:330 length:201 start_codon:yes stop_codon:yes gene_type:complete
MINVYNGKQYRIFKDKILFFPYYILEDSTKAVQKQGVWYGIKITNYYFKTLNYVKKQMSEIEHANI